MKPIFVEFAGLPGAGKTTAAHAVVAELRAHGHAASRRPPLVRAGESLWGNRWRMLAFWLGHWRLIAETVHCALSIRPLQLRRLRVIDYLMFRACHQRRHRNAGFEVIIVDQSVVQTVWGMIADATSYDRHRLRALLAAFYRAAGVAPVFVHFRLDPATAAQRVVQRKWAPNRFDNLPEGQLETIFSARRATLDRVVELAVASLAVPCLEIDGTRATSDASARIARFLAELLARRDSAVPARGADLTARSDVARALPKEIEV